MFHYIVEVDGYHEKNTSNGVTISEIILYDNNNNKINYTVGDAYDSVANGIPSYWNQEIWGKSKLNDDQWSYVSNENGNTTTALLLYPRAIGNHFARFVIKTTEMITSMTIYIGSMETRIPQKINFYLCDTNDEQEIKNKYLNINRAMDKLTLLNQIIFKGDEVTTQPQTIRFDEVYYLLSDDEGVKTINSNGEIVLLSDTISKELFKTKGFTDLSLVPDSYVSGNKVDKKILMISNIPNGQKISVKKYSRMYNPVTKRYEGTGAIYIPLKDLPENAKKCRIHLKGYNYFCKTALSKTPGQSSTLFTSDNPQYGGGILEIDMKAPPMTTTHKHTKDNPFMLCVSTGGDNGYLEAVSYSWL